MASALVDRQSAPYLFLLENWDQYPWEEGMLIWPYLHTFLPGVFSPIVTSGLSRLSYGKLQKAMSQRRKAAA
jgi:hypothetical protein